MSDNQNLPSPQPPLFKQDQYDCLGANLRKFSDDVLDQDVPLRKESNEFVLDTPIPKKIDITGRSGSIKQLFTNIVDHENGNKQGGVANSLLVRRNQTGEEL